MDEIQQARDYGETKHAEGVVEGKSSALLTILGARGLTVDQAARQRIALCKEPALLDAWISRATSASSADDVFA